MDQANARPLTFRKTKRLWLALPILWAAFIATTSCFFIERSVFIRLIGRLIPAGAPQHAWTMLWLSCGLLIVKGYHMTEFALLFCLVFFALLSGTAWSVNRIRGWSFAFCVLYAVLDEWHQTFVPGRGGTIIDVGIDSLGITCAALWITARQGRGVRDRR